MTPADTHESRRRRTKVCEAGDCEIDAVLVQFAACGDVWYDPDTGDCQAHLEEVSVAGDVAETCPSCMEVERREWGGYAPGLSGTWYTVWTYDKKSFKGELAKRLRLLAAAPHKANVRKLLASFRRPR